MIDKVLEGVEVLHLAKGDFAKTGLAWSVFLAKEQLIAAVKALYGAEYLLEDVTAIDAKEGYLVVYHFDHMATPGRVALRVLIPHDVPEIPSIAAVFQGAEWHERETTDFYGITFVGNPNPVPLLLPVEMKERPLRKSETARTSLAEFIAPGEVVRSSADFKLFAAPAADGAETAV